MEFLIGILCGVILSWLFSFGPAFFGLIQNSIHHGFRRATAFAVGVSLSDVVVVFLMLTVLQNVDMGSVMHNVYVALICGVGISYIGIRTFRKKAIVKKGGGGSSKFSMSGTERTWQLMLNGFLLNILNPFIWIYWISVISFVSAEADMTTAERYIFFAGLLFATLGCDMLKCRLASLLQTWFTARVLNLFNKITGLVLIGFGVYMVVSMVLYQTNPKIREKEQENTPQSTKIMQSLHHHMNRDTGRHADTIYFR